MNYEIVNIEQSANHITVTTMFGEDCAAIFDLSNRFVRGYVVENGLNKFETEYGSGIETEADIDTFISEELDYIVKHILKENS